MVSVVMSVLNGERFLREAVESILSQSFNDFEFIIVNDGSTDGTAAILDSYVGRDLRLRVYHQENRGTCASDNRGCAMARGKYIAHLDGDDVAVPDRLERQIGFLENNEKVGIVGGAFEIIDERGRRISVEHPPLDHESIRAGLGSFSLGILHSAATMRKQAFEAVGGYRSQFERAEDFDLSLRICDGWRAANLADVVVRRRVHSQQVSVCYLRQQTLSALGAIALSSARQLQLLEPPCQVPAISEEYLEQLGVGASTRDGALARVYLYWIGSMEVAFQQDAVLRLVDELIVLSKSGGVDKVPLSNAMLLAARAHFRMGRPVRALGSMARAVRTRPGLLRDVFWDIVINRTFPLRKRLGLRRRRPIERDSERV